MYSGNDDLLDITDYLTQLSSEQIYNLGIVLRLDHDRVTNLQENCRSNQSFLDKVITSWLQKADRVGEVSWVTLVRALRHARLGQTGIADRIVTEHGL